MHIFLNPIKSRLVKYDIGRISSSKLFVSFLGVNEKIVLKEEQQTYTSVHCSVHKEKNDGKCC